VSFARNAGCERNPTRRANSSNCCSPQRWRLIPTGIPPVGWASDIENLRVKDANEFFGVYYVPGNITISIVGDVDPKRMQALATGVLRPPRETPSPEPRPDS